MDQKPVKSKNMFLKFIPKGAASAVSFQNPLYSPGRDHATKLKAHNGRGFSGPILIPAEARRKSKNSSFAAQEPTSPKISCMGQIKHKKMICKQKSTSASLPKEFKPFSAHHEVEKKKKKKPSTLKTTSSFSEEKKKKTSAIRNIFKSGKPAGRKSDASADHYKPPLPDTAPSLSQMTKFASGRDSFANFDWTAQVAPVDSDHRNYYSDEDRSDHSDGEEEYDNDVIIPFSAPILIGGGGGVALEPRKEINIWKRRTMAQPKPLRLNTMG